MPRDSWYWARALDDVIDRDELMANVFGDSVDIRFTLTREQPEGWQGYARRIDAAMLAEALGGPDAGAVAYVCGPTSFVEVAAEALVGLGYEPGRVRTERFGPTGR